MSVLPPVEDMIERAERRVRKGLRTRTMAENVNIGTGFKVDSITLYTGYAQVNGTFVRDVQPGGVPSNQLSFSTTMDEGKALVPGQVYDFKLEPQPDTPTVPEQPAP